jgi:anti-sigma factor RsiW
MTCTHWTERLTERLYGEIAPQDDAALAEHLGSCEGCRTTLEEFQRVRTLLQQDAPDLARVPRVVVLRDRPRFRPALLAASILCAAVLAGAGAGLGYALGLGHAEVPPMAQTAKPGEPSVSTEAMVQREVDRRLAAWEASRPTASVPKFTSAPDRAAGDAPVSSTALRAELAKLERKMNGARTADIDYVLDQIAASEVRVGDRIGKTNQALRTVALASNPPVNEQ